MTTQAMPMEFARKFDEIYRRHQCIVARTSKDPQLVVSSEAFMHVLRDKEERIEQLLSEHRTARQEFALYLEKSRQESNPSLLDKYTAILKDDLCSLQPFHMTKDRDMVHFSHPTQPKILTLCLNDSNELCVSEFEDGVGLDYLGSISDAQHSKAYGIESLKQAVADFLKA